MDNYELLTDEAHQNGVDVVDYAFNSNRIKGLYCDRIAAISNALKGHVEKSCVLAEELGHHHTTSGDILNQKSSADRKQELRARIWAYNKLIGLRGIIDAYTHGCRSIADTAEYLDITENFLMEAISRYKSKYGIYTMLDNYVIIFEPSVCVLELI